MYTGFLIFINDPFQKLLYFFMTACHKFKFKIKDICVSGLASVRQDSTICCNGYAIAMLYVF